ncbi:MAG: hypothetical protein ACFFAN_19025 [Promethearchaeota archaeon]
MMLDFILIAGGGKFGKKALEFGKKKNYKIIIIDNNPNCYVAKFVNKKFDNLHDINSKLKEIEPGEICLLIQDAPFAYELIIKTNPAYIIPVVPIHLTASLITYFLSIKNEINLTSDAKSATKFVNYANREILLAYNINEGVAYLSYAKVDEICPDNCTGPFDYCPNFNREKPITITKYLKNYYNIANLIRIDEKIISKIIIINESYQLMPGLGGLRGKDINHILQILNEYLDVLSNQKFNIIIATTCNCHGVINFYKN